MPTLYIDVIAVENYIMDFFILYMTDKLLSAGRSSHRTWRGLLRIAAGAAIGTVYAVCSVTILKAALSMLILKLLLSLVMVVVSFEIHNIKGFIKAVACFYVISFLSGGVAMGVLMLGGAQITGGVIQWDGALNYIVLAVAGAGIAVDVILRIVREKKYLTQNSAELYIQFDSEREGIWIPSLIDSGNQLTDPYSNAPIVVVELSSVATLLPTELAAFLKQNDAEDIMTGANIEVLRGWEHRFRLIPFSSLGCDDGMLPGFRADRIRIRASGYEDAELNNQTVCLCERTLSGNRKYRALIASEMMNPREIPDGEIDVREYRHFTAEKI